MILLLAWAAGAARTRAQDCGAPRFTMQPANQLVLAGMDASFHVDMLDEGCAFTYTWYYFGSVVVGTVGPTLIVPSVQPPSTNGDVGPIGPYSVVVSEQTPSGFLTATSYVAYLSVVTGPMPAAVKVPPGADVTFSNFVYSFGGPGPATQQWLFRGQDIPGETNTTLTLKSVGPDQAGGYSVRVKSRGNMLVTPNAWLTVQGPPRLWGMEWRTEGAHFMVSGCCKTAYRIDATHDFLQWTEILATNAPAGGTFEVFDPDASSFDWRCYRAVEP